MEKFFVFKDTFSLLGGLYQLITSNEIFLFLLVFMLSVAMPLCKFYISFNIAFNRLAASEMKLQRTKIMAIFGKWSMTDVFLIAVLASTIKLGGLAQVNIHIGLPLFGTSVLLSILLTNRLMSPYELRLKSELP